MTIHRKLMNDFLSWNFSQLTAVISYHASWRHCDSWRLQ